MTDSIKPYGTNDSPPSKLSFFNPPDEESLQAINNKASTKLNNDIFKPASLQISDKAKLNSDIKEKNWQKVANINNFLILSNDQEENQVAESTIEITYLESIVTGSTDGQSSPNNLQSASGKLSLEINDETQIADFTIEKNNETSTHDLIIKVAEQTYKLSGDAIPDEFYTKLKKAHKDWQP